jgi:hypothetical protein
LFAPPPVCTFLQHRPRWICLSPPWHNCYPTVRHCAPAPLRYNRKWLSWAAPRWPQICS